MFDFRLFDYVQLFNCSISERSIVFDCRTQSKSIERLEFDWVRLPNVRLTTPGITNEFPQPGQNYNFNLCIGQIEASTCPPAPGIPRAFDTFAVPGRREFDYQSLPGGGEFDPHALGVGNLN